MYLKNLAIENSGPIRSLRLAPAFHDNGNPKPIVLVGPNGCGKTNLLSLIADALFEAAATHYHNVLPTQGAARSWFRIVGGATTTVGSPGGFSVLKFTHAGQDLSYVEKAGHYPASDASLVLPADMQAAADWSETGNIKRFNLSDDASKEIFAEGAYAYFPSSRSEVPFWMNQKAIATEFIDANRFANTLEKPIFVERGLHGFKQWLMALIMDARADIAVQNTPTGQQIVLASNANHSLATHPVLDAANLLLKKIMDDPEMRFVWLGRKSGDKVSIAKNRDLYIPNLSALSSGQSILLGVFGTLLRYGDFDRADPVARIEDVEGICIIDEVDAHVHIDLQTNILPELISLFPRVQFIVSSHSPLFAIGMERRFGPAGFKLIEMPEGRTITAESYAEFGKAFEVLTATASFSNRVEAETRKHGIPIIFVEGETDEPYVKAAATALGRSQLLERCELQWIGAKDERGQGFHTGKDALKHTLNMLRANPQLAGRPVLLLNDNDTSSPPAQYGSVWVRSLPAPVPGRRVQSGIENLLPEGTIRPEDYQEKRIEKPNGDLTTTSTLRKADLCSRICAQPDMVTFHDFGAVLDTIEEFLNGVTAPPPIG